MPYEALQVAMEANIPVIWTGEPGVGKTSIIRAICQARQWPLETIIASICEPSDLGGLPVIDNGGVRRVPPRWATELDKRCRFIGDGGSKAGVMFFDELSTAAPANQAAVLRISQEKVVGDLELPETVRFVAAANPAHLAAGGWDLSAPLANRLCHIKWQTDANTWVNGMQAGFPAPATLPFHPNWRENIPKYMSLVASFVKAQPQKLLLVPKDEQGKGQAWASPRTWHYGAILLACGDSVGKLTQLECLSGMVGDGPASEFFSWLDKMDLPAPEDVLKDPKKFFKKPGKDEEHRTHAIVAAALAIVENKPGKQMWDKGWTLLSHVGQWSPDVAAGFVGSMARIKNKSKTSDWRVPDVARPFLKRMGKAMEVVS